MWRLALFIVVCFSSAGALAAGDNSHPQGVRFAGLGFDKQEVLKPAQWVPWFGNTIWPPQSGTYNSIGGTPQIRVEAKCEPDPITNTLFALCYGTVRDVSSGKTIIACDSNGIKRSGRRALAAAPQKDSVPLLAIRGKLNTASGAFERDIEVLTFACAPTFRDKHPRWLSETRLITGDLGPPPDPKTNLDSSENLGVLAKCYFWGFGEPKNTEDSRLATYQACLRAARAEYCGGGISQTQSGTFIQVYEPLQTQVGLPVKVTMDPLKCKNLKDPKSDEDVTKRKDLKFTPCFEAIWDDKGATCVSHARYEEMPAKDCRNNFPNAFSVEIRSVDGGVVVFGVPVDPSSDKVYLNCQSNNYQSAVGQARVKNRSGINKLTGEVKGCKNDIPCP